MGCNTLHLHRFCLTLLLICGSFLLHAQETFTANQATYLKEVSDFFTSADKKDGKVFIEQTFTPFWNGALSESERSDIYEMTNDLAKLRFRAYPEFFDFFSTAIALQGDAANYTAWMETLKALQKGKKSNLTGFNEHMGMLSRDASLIDKSTVRWKYKGGGYSLEAGKKPKLTFSEVDLVCYAKRDSSCIYTTSGVYDILQKRWKGEGGKVDWQRAGLSTDETYAELKGYDISMKSSDFSADSVLFYNEFFNEPLLGTLNEKIIAGKDEKSASFPQFESYEKRLLIKDIAESMDYDGGFSMKGSKLIGSGSLEEPARIVIFRDDKPFLIARSLAYTISPDRIASENAKVAIYMSEDSITHPGLQFRFVKDKSLLTLVRTDEGVSKSPFFNSFHELDMYFEALYWNMKDPLMTMGNLFGSSNKKAAFESKDYYKESRYYALQGMDPVHPLIKVRDLTKQVGDGFYVADYARSTRLPADVAKKQLIILANQGFLEYDAESEYVEVRDKMEAFVMNRAGKRDYDILLFNSISPKDPNATLSLINYDLLLKGVGKINLSDSQRVSIYPDGKEITVKQNRNFFFNGVTVAGNVELFGTDCRFSYDDFKVDITAIDSVRLNVEQFDFTGQGRKPIKTVTNVLEGGKGVLSIDQPQNKSGLKQEEYPTYPFFESLEESFVYYDKGNIQGGAYDREDFFYKAEPYMLDSLDNFIANNISLDGVLISGIFPNIVNPLSVQPDYSLGFERNTDSGGLTAYKGKTNFNDKIILSGSGLQGDGTIEYLTATAVGELFTFLPDSTIGTTTSFINTEKLGGSAVPEANAGKVYIAYAPEEDRLTARTIDDEISCFNGQASIIGELILRPEGMEGEGTMLISGAELDSKLFTYTDHDIRADTADFRLTGLTDDFAFKTEEVNAHVDFNERKGEFKSNGEASFVEFPANQYVCFMDKFVWFMDQNDLALEYDGQVSNDFVIDTDLDITKSNFFSTREDQDSLNFMSPKAVYDLDEGIISCGEIDFIKVADARISPDSGTVVIRKKARMDPLEDAVIVTNFITAYHTIRNADLEIKSSKDYSGSGDYTYLDEDKGEQIISFNNIRVDSAYQTIANGQVIPTADFSLSPAFQYSGDVDLFANTKGLYFEGQTRVFHDCDLDKNWMNFEAEIDPDNVLIPVDSLLTDDIGLPVGIGLLMDNETLDLYSTFLSSIHAETDKRLISSQGQLTYDKKTSEYLVGSTDKLRERNLNGNLIALETKTCQVRGEGKMNFGIDLGQMKLDPVGRYVNNTAENSFTIDAMLPIDFFFSDNALKIMQEDFSKNPNLKPLLITNSMYQMGLKELLGLDAADKLISELTLSGTVKKLPTDLSKTIVLSDVKMVWDSEEARYVSEGPIGLANIGKTEIFAEVKGVLTMSKKRGGDGLTLYLEMDEDTWYFLEYGRTVLQAYSSNTEFNEIIINEKEDDRRSKGEKGDDAYSYMLSSKRKKDIFLDDMGF